MIVKGLFVLGFFVTLFVHLLITFSINDKIQSKNITECTDKKHDWKLVGMGTYKNHNHFNMLRCNHCKVVMEDGLLPEVTKISRPTLFVVAILYFAITYWIKVKYLG